MRVQKNSLATQVKEALLDRILKGRYKPGDRLVKVQVRRVGVAGIEIRATLMASP